MGASVRAYWNGITEEQLQSQPGFGNDCKAWGNWMAERKVHPDVLKTMRELGVDALLVCKTNYAESQGMQKMTLEVNW